MIDYFIQTRVADPTGNQLALADKSNYKQIH